MKGLKNHMTSNDDQISESLGILPGVSIPVNLQGCQKYELADDTVGSFQRQTLCQKYQLLDGMNPMTLDASQLK